MCEPVDIVDVEVATLVATLQPWESQAIDDEAELTLSCLTLGLLVIERVKMFLIVSTNGLVSVSCDQINPQSYTFLFGLYQASSAVKFCFYQFSSFLLSLFPPCLTTW